MTGGRSLVVAGWLLVAAGCGDPRTSAVVGQLDLSAETIDLGSVPVLHERSAPLELRNLGRAALTVQRVRVGEADAPFGVSAPPASLEPGESVRLDISFKPPAEALFTATLVVESDDEGKPAAQVALVGRGATRARLEADAALDFGRVCEGGEAVARLGLRSRGDAALLIGGITLEPGTAPELTVVTSTRTPVRVEPGGELSLSLRAAPRAGSPEVLAGALLLEDVSDPDRTKVRIPVTARVNRAPTAAIQTPAANAAPGALVPLDGSGSADADGDLPLAFEWAIRASPLGSRSTPSPVDAEDSGVLLDLPGRYTAQLTVTDAAGCRSEPAVATIHAPPTEQLLVELVWTNARTDLDLHLAPDAEAFFGPRDCYFADANRWPDWGVAGDTSDDPRLTRDALTGYGPELIAYAAPAPGRYKVLVDFFADHGAAPAATEATLRIYVLGVVRAELRRTLEAEGKRWIAATIDWPGGEVTKLDVLQ